MGTKPAGYGQQGRWSWGCDEVGYGAASKRVRFKPDTADRLLKWLTSLYRPALPKRAAGQLSSAALQPALLGRRQVVRQWILIPPYGGSNPPAPASQSGAQRFYPHKSEKCPPMAGFCELASGLQAPYLTTFTAKTPKVSGYLPRYSRFRETTTGDRFRSTLRGGRGSAISGIY